MANKNLGWIIAGILFIILLIAGTYFGYKYLQQKSFVKGYNTGQLDLAIKINQNGQIPVINQQENQTLINWINIRDLCSQKWHKKIRYDAKKTEFCPRHFDKFHQKEKLEMIVLNCRDCQRLITHIYLGNFGNLLKLQHTYQCMHCKTLYVSPKKLKLKK